nr:MAG TPA: hypothetical protein [Caudoviricetes sp.]
MTVFDVCQYLFCEFVTFLIDNLFYGCYCINRK